jgi:hypothetical protein
VALAGSGWLWVALGGSGCSMGFYDFSMFFYGCSMFFYDFSVILWFFYCFSMFFYDLSMIFYVFLCFSMIVNPSQDHQEGAARAPIVGFRVFIFTLDYHY